MKRKVLCITGTRADYGLMRPVFQGIAESGTLDLVLVVTGMHLLPEFADSLAQIQADAFGKPLSVSMILGEDTGKAMAQSFGLAVYGISAILDEQKPDIVLVQGDRGEMLAGAIAAAHMNIPVVHMSGGDHSGSIDDSIRNAITKFAHVHLTTCGMSSRRVRAMGEEPNRIFEVGEPGLDVIKNMRLLSRESLASDFRLDISKPIIMATQHPVTTESDQAAWQIGQTLDALAELNVQTVFTYPNSDSGGREMARVLESYRDREFIRIIPNLGSEKYLSLMSVASVLVGNSSSGILEAPSFKVPVVNIGTRQHGRLRANNVVDAGYAKDEIVRAIRYTLTDAAFRASLKKCRNPYGDGTAAFKTIDILQSLRISSALTTKWIGYHGSLVIEE